MKDRKVVNSCGRGHREALIAIQGGQIVIKIYCIRKEYIFNKGVQNKTFLSQ